MSEINEEIALYKQALTTCKDILNTEAANTAAELQFMAATADTAIKQLQDPTLTDHISLENMVSIAATVSDVTALAISVCTDRNLAIPQCVSDAHFITGDVDDVLEIPTSS